MSISIGTSAPSSARQTHAAWLRLRGECRQLWDQVLDAAPRENPESRDVIARPQPGSGGNTLL
ncbi:hypothetical protein [Actinoplanes siamensis]|uniref:Uncharacterized protein n=1 Tax=Actinoplanes siamensis TaxID=1223317 RepID=A0A919THR0_9ACTN|nr:hypothetical protein [Actinoplanes siamensis]GIF04056.1 hypothetical protein Asi03nite_15940 [Actinoplanes siamensis]